MPNNRYVAQQRLTGVKKKRDKKKFHQEYTDFLENVINGDYAEKVPQDELRNVFYLPHHGVYHPR